MEKFCRDIWRTIEDTIFEQHGCLLPAGDITVDVILHWNKEEVLGSLKRRGKIASWVQDREFEDGNMRRYKIIVDSEKI
ncbi:hypothetical protein [Selenomonas ruminantium]|uniref:Uncharacterized protein n=1 Tax=Selenomonas ruminantium TaxID=971 RepID=A0A1M6UZ75_SELRU|nr:hypothetical protein [Selenomonas ruminantium]SDP38739.1 hypothetical protein SAMN05216366_11643 [Selenomonas ruminantium]SHK74513.1 hypothetical protein SAMN05216582_11567 [Selenomonas ruminantium]